MSSTRSIRFNRGQMAAPLTAIFFETGAMSVPTKLQNPTICGWGDSFQSYLTPFLRVLSISGFLKVIHAPKTPKRGFLQVPQKLTSSIAFFKSLQSGLPINLIDTPIFLRFMGSPDCQDLNNAMEEVNFWGTWKNPLLGVLGAWMTFKKPEMDKTLNNGVKYDWNQSPQPQWPDQLILVSFYYFDSPRAPRGV